MGNKSVVITLPTVGAVLLERSNRAKHIRMSIKPPSKIRVAVPVGISFEEAQNFAEEKESWLQKQIQKFSISKSMCLAQIAFGESLEELRPDSIVVLGDRYEIFSAVAAGMIARIPIAHIHGGETTEGAIDESIRHSITKMSHICLLYTSDAADE